MFILLKGAQCYGPECLGKQDILIAGGRIEKIGPDAGRAENSLPVETIDCGGLLAFPGLIDQHVHIIGGGGEQGFPSRIGEMDAGEIFLAGVTTLVGLLGADRCTKSLESLYARAKSLESDGLTTYIYSGSYTLPAVTFTGNLMRDLFLIDKVIGAGEIAISDHRSSQPDRGELLRMASETHLGGMIAGKAGVVHLHVGDGNAGLGPLLDLLEHSDLPKEQFVPTHVNRNEMLFGQAVDYCRGGGNIDLTAGETAGIAVPDALKSLLDRKLDVSRVTVSSDSNGSIPSGGVSRAQSLYDDIRKCILEKNILPETAFRFVTENVARVLKFFPRKGALREGSDADILLTDRDYKIQKLFCGGKQVVDNACRIGG